MKQGRLLAAWCAPPGQSPGLECRGERGDDWGEVLARAAIDAAATAEAHADQAEGGQGER